MRVCVGFMNTKQERSQDLREGGAECARNILGATPTIEVMLSLHICSAATVSDFIRIVRIFSA